MYSSAEVLLKMINDRPYLVMQPHPKHSNEYPLHVECLHHYRSAILSKCIEIYPQALAKADVAGYLPLHRLLERHFSSDEDALMMIEKYPIALRHPTSFSELPLYIECQNQCRSSIISKCIELYPEALAADNIHGYLPLHQVLKKNTSSTEEALMMMEKYPAALHHQNINGELPLHIECMHQCRSAIISKYIELFPEALDTKNGQGCIPLIIPVNCLQIRCLNHMY
jgi:hypothetical protein